MRYFASLILLLVSISYPNLLQAQTCSGNFGEPVVNLSFGSGTHPGPSRSTNYNYTPNDCPNDGSYTIVKSTSGCFGSWHTLPEDHTPGDTDGYMMLVNASNDPGEFFNQRITDLCPGTTYEFSAYIVNVLRLGARTDTRPNLTFSIEGPDGSLLSSYNTGVIMESASPEWKKYSLIFRTTASISSVVLRIVNNAPGGNGNDLALDDITFRACGPTILPSINAGQIVPAVCAGQPFDLELDASVSAGFSDPAYQWQQQIGEGAWEDIPGASSRSYRHYVSSTSPEGYSFRLAAAESFNMGNQKCRILSAELRVEIQPLPEADAGPDLSTMQNRPVQLQGRVGGQGLSFRWTPPDHLDDPGRLDALASPPADMTYTLEVSDGCTTVRDEVFVKVYEELIVPAAFTPNADGVNDEWVVAGLRSYPEAVVEIYNRYGSRVFLSRGYEQAWQGSFKGEPLPAGVYYYVIDLKTSVLKGSVAILK